MSMNVRIVAVACAALVTAGTVCAQTFEPNVNRGGSDYRGFIPPTPDPRLCQKACVDEVACLAWTHDKLGTKCWLKYAIPHAAADGCCTSGVVRSAAGMKVAHAKEAFEKRGLLGVFSVDCAKPASPTNHYHVVRPIDGERIQWDAMIGPAERMDVWVGEVATEPAPNRLTIHAAHNNRRMTHTVLLEGKRWRTLEMQWDNGNKVDGLGHPWYTKCE